MKYEITGEDLLKGNFGVLVSYQNEKLEIVEERICSIPSFYAWCSINLRNGNKKLYVVLTQDGEKEYGILITASIEEIESFFEYVFIGNKFIIQEFGTDDYKEAIEYLMLYKPGINIISSNPFRPSNN